MGNHFVKFFGVFIYCLSSVAQAGFEDGNSLKQKCLANGFAEGVCVGYIEGVADVLSPGLAINGFKACFPKEIITSQMLSVVKNWMDVNPEKLHYSASGLVAAALASAFPCK